jgi:hypothetical protein
MSPSNAAAGHAHGAPLRCEAARFTFYTYCYHAHAVYVTCQFEFLLRLES